MTSVWAPLALTAVTCGMLALPLAPALLEAWRRKDAGPLPVRRDDGDIRNFARSFRHRIEPLRSALISCAESNSVVEARLDDGDCALLIGNDGASNLDEERLSTLVLFARQARLRDQVIFEKDVYAAAGLCGGRNNIFRALLGENNVMLAEASQVLRWIHVEGELAVGRNSDLGSRCSSQKVIYFGSGCRFQRVYAPTIVTSSSALLVSTLPTCIPSTHAATGPSLGRSRIHGSLHLGPGEVLLGNIVATGAIRIEEGGRIHGSAKGNGDIELRPQTRIDGSLISTGVIRIGSHCMIKGPVLAEHEISIAPDTQIGTSDSPTTISAPRIRIAPDCVVHGTLWARLEGSVEE